MSNDISQISAAVERIRHSFLAYCIWRKPDILIGRHHRIIADALERVQRGELKRLCISLHPRAGKSLLVSELFPQWFMGLRPEAQLIAVSYASALAQQFGGKVRQAMTDPEYVKVFPGAQPWGRSRAGAQWTTRANGVYKSVGVGGAITGFGGDLILVDDVVKSKATAMSPTYQAMLREFFGATLYTRLMPGGAMILMMTRWHKDDMIGYVLREFADAGWEYINIPALAVEDNDLLGRMQGEAMWPEFFDEKALADIRKTLPEDDWQALYQGSPTGAGGLLIEAEDFGFYRQSELPPLRYVYSTWDTASSTRNSADFSAGFVLGLPLDLSDKSIYVLDRFKGRVDFNDLQSEFIAMAARNRCNINLVEYASSGIQLVQSLDRLTKLPIKPVIVGSDLYARVSAVLPVLKQRPAHIKLPLECKWTDDVITEHCDFPKGSHDDQISSLVQGVHFAMVNFGLWSPRENGNLGGSGIRLFRARPQFKFD